MWLIVLVFVGTFAQRDYGLIMSQDIKNDATITESRKEEAYLQKQENFLRASLSAVY